MSQLAFQFYIDDEPIIAEVVNETEHIFCISRQSDGTIDFAPKPGMTPQESVKLLIGITNYILETYE